MPRIGSYCVSLQCFDFILGVSVLVHTKDVQMRIKAQWEFSSYFFKQGRLLETLEFQKHVIEVNCLKKNISFF